MQRDNTPDPWPGAVSAHFVDGFVGGFVGRSADSAARPRRAGPLRLAALALGLTAWLPLTPVHAQAQEGLRHEFAIHWAPAALANDDRRSRSLAYDRHFGEGWWLGASLGYGKVLSSDGGDGVYGMVRARKRLAELAVMPGLSPQFGIEYGGTTDVFDSVDLLGLFAGLHFALSPELGLTTDLWLGRGRFERSDLLQTTDSRKGTVRNVRLGLVFRY